MASPPKLLVLGASYTGLALVQTLLQQRNTPLEITVVDTRNYFEMNFSTPRMVQEPKIVDALVLPMSSVPMFTPSAEGQSAAKFLCGTVTALRSKEAVLASGDTVAFDYCAICTGSQYSNTFNKGTTAATEAERKALLKETAARVTNADSVLIIGGGLTGMEMAVECKEAGAKAVTMVHTGSHLCATPKQGTVPLKRMKALGVEVILEQRAKQVDEDGKTFEFGTADARTFDEVFWCTGPKPQTAFLGGLEGVTDEKGFVSVDATLQVKGHAHMFAGGDCIHVDDEMTAYLGTAHAALIAQNLLKLVRNPENAKLAAWKKNNGMRMTLATLGGSNALAFLGEETTCTTVPKSMFKMKNDMTAGKVGMKLTWPK